MTTSGYALNPNGDRGFVARTLVGRVLESAIVPQIDRGHLRVVLPSGETIERRGPGDGVDATITFLRWRALWRILRQGRFGIAQGWIDGDWSTPDLDALFAFGLQNFRPVVRKNRGSYLARTMNRFRHRKNANTRHRSRRNISTHYDLGNAFYAHWLDDGMTYSSGLYLNQDESLEAAQAAKLAQAVALLDLNGEESVLEIGCGWGSLAERLITVKNCKVTGLTLSEEQEKYAQSRLSVFPKDKADIRLQDYREVEGRFDRIVSIEMIEAVGERYWPTFFERLRAALKNDGIAVLQAITILEEDFPTYRDQPDFIQRYIFPGGMLPTTTIIREQAEQAGLSLVAHQSFGQSYAQTLREWRNRFLAAWPQIERLGFDERFRRLWIYYLAYCEAGFHDGSINVGFFKFVPTECREHE